MKLYTEEQVRKAYFEGWNDGQHENIGYIDTVVDSLTPIELPSDGQIIIMSLPKDVGDSHSSDYIKGFNEGAKWVISHVKQQDNGN